MIDLVKFEGLNVLRQLLAASVQDWRRILDHVPVRVKV